MGERRFWQRIDLRWANALLLGVIGLCVAFWWSELRWAADELPRYLGGSIGSPPERQMYRRARELILSGEDPDRARRLLEQSIAIDPHSDAVYWLARHHMSVGDTVRAEENLRRFLDFDPTQADAYLDLSRLLLARGEREQARELLLRGVERLERIREQLTPVPDPEVAMKYNTKAMGVHAYQIDGIERLRVALRGLEPTDGTR